MSNEDRLRIRCTCPCHSGGLVHFAPCCEGGWIYQDKKTGFKRPENDLGAAWKKLTSELFIKHKGCLGERQGESILFNGCSYLTEASFKEAVDKYLEEGGNIINESINREK